MIKILIVEDDPMVAVLNQQFTEKMNGTKVIGSAKTVAEAYLFLDNHTPDLILLDVYLPRKTGIEFAKELQEKKLYIPIIMITASDDMEMIEKAISYGVIDYLIKPFTFERFELSISKFIDFQNTICHKGKTSQSIVDSLFLSEKKEAVLNNNVFSVNLKDNQNLLPKGLSKLTLKKVYNAILECKEWFSTEDVANKIEISRISTKKYLQFLFDTGFLKEKIKYQHIGRPITLYYIKKELQQKLQDYFS